MQDKQDKGIGRYRDRPGYFMGGMIGGAILGALVNKVQGKDWKRGALWGGIGGGITGGLTGSGGLGGWLNAGEGATWLAKKGLMQNMIRGAAPLLKNPWVTSGIGAGAAQFMGDPAYDARKQQEAIEDLEEKRRRKNLEQYAGWYDDPWADWNKGGIINARPKYQHGGGAWSDVAGDEEVPGSYEDRVLSITGQGGIEGQGGLEDIMETFDVSSGPGQGDMSGWYEMYEDLKGKGELPDWMDSFEIFMQNLDVLDISPWDFSARGGYKMRPKYAGGGMTDAEKKAYQGLLDSGYTEDEAIKIIELHGSDYSGLQVPEFLKSQAGDARGGYKKRPQYAGGGMEDMDMTGGGASFGPGTGTSDDIPAMLSDGEFVVTANAVQNLGGGDRMLGARRMYQMMNQLDPNSQTPAEMNTVGIA